uniref:NADH-ubiquinone oxidoreductase chain 4 n=1 Tax=Ochetellus glaber TaxID=255795 RepID=A0A6B9BQU4_9HYME|nr:NADH dehydrogenase subunit 4 [Ochetellus glaber]QGW36339.1 NADH dehydrogenase subunit 4 [Ochetellus glaber]
MMKFIFMLMFMIFMMSCKLKSMLMNLYFNLMFIMSFMYMFMYMEIKDICIHFVLGYFGLDNYSFFMVMLSMWILGLMFMSLDSWSLIKMFLFLVLMIIFVGVFSSLSMMIFYFFFEVSLIPTFFLIIYWGVNPERLSAGFYLMLYTMFISLPFLVYIFWFLNQFGTFNMNLMLIYVNDYDINFFDYLMIFSAFFIKLPIYMFHVWLPKAHVEAPVYGSMVLAAVLLKLGTYGLIRLLMIFIYSCIYFNYLVFSVSLVGSFVIGLVCLIQIDLKSLVAYSSVVHMNFLLMSMMTMMKLGFLSSYIMMIGHGLCSSGLFYMVNIYYQKTYSRIIFFNKGMLTLLPMYTVWWFFLCSSNFSFPLSLNFISEILMISSVISWSFSMFIFLMIICFFSSAYSLYLFSYIQYGEVYIEKKISFILVKNVLVLILHLYPLVFVLLNLIIFY